MNPSITDRLPKPDPNVEQFQQVLQRRPASRIPLVELAIAEESLTEIQGEALLPFARQHGSQQFRKAVQQRVRLWHALGYDYYRVRAEIPFAMATLSARDTAESATGERHWINEHDGIIKSLANFESYPATCWACRA